MTLATPRRRRVEPLTRRDRRAVRSPRRDQATCCAARFEAVEERWIGRRTCWTNSEVGARRRRATLGPAQLALPFRALRAGESQSDYGRADCTSTATATACCLIAHGGGRANEEHRAIAAAVAKKDVKSATQLMREHILGAGQSLLELLHEQRAVNGGAAAAK